MILFFISVVLFVCWLDFNNDRIPAQLCHLEVIADDPYDDAKDDHHIVVHEKYIPNRTIGRPQRIPYWIFETHENNQIPWKTKYAVNTYIEKNPEYNYRYFNSSERREIIKHYLGKIPLDCYDKLNANAFKADFFRFSIVYIYGGCYFDLPYVSLEPINSAFNEETQFFSNVDDKSEDYSMNAAGFCAIPQHKIVYNTLLKIINGISNESYGESALDISGPQKFRSGVKQIFGVDKIFAGFYDKNIIISERWKQHMCLASIITKPNGQFLAASRYPDYRIDIARYLNVPHYSRFYDNKTVYNKSIVITVLEDYRLPSSQEINHLHKIIDFRQPRQYVQQRKEKQKTLLKNNNV